MTRIDHVDSPSKQLLLPTNYAYVYPLNSLIYLIPIGHRKTSLARYISYNTWKDLLLFIGVACMAMVYI